MSDPEQIRSEYTGMRESILKRDGYECQAPECSENRDDSTELEVHHILPVSVGGTNDPENLVTLCEECHGELHTQGFSKRLPPEMLPVITIPETSDDWVDPDADGPDEMTDEMKMDDRGQVYVPKAVREALGIDGEETTVEITVRVEDE